MEEILSKVSKIYLVGIGGVGMSGLALLLNDRGIKVAGSDIRRSYTIDILEKSGIKVHIGHDPKQIDPQTDILVYSSAINNNNPEIIFAKEKGIRLIKRGTLLGYICKDKRTVSVSGSHGKTTTTSLIGYLLSALDYKPTVFVGGLPLNYSRGAFWGDDYFVIETDESDGSFLQYHPFVSIITNIDKE